MRRRTIVKGVGLYLTAMLRILVLVVAVKILTSGLPQVWGSSPTEISEICSTVEKTIRGKLIQCDEKPSIKFDGFEGYRIVLRDEWKEEMELRQVFRSPSEPDELDPSKVTIKYSHSEIALFPSESDISADMKDRIPWKDLEQVYHTRPIYLGEGHGYKWFGHTTIFDQHYLRKDMGLVGGDDPLKLVADGLGIKDTGTMTINSAIGILRNAGEKAIPYIMEVIKNNESDPFYSMQALGGIPGEKPTEIIRDLYYSDNERLSKAAESALVIRPFRESAKEEYLDMLQRRVHILLATEACIEFGWKEAIPILEEILNKPPSFRTYRKVYEIKRALEGNPIPAELIEAEGLLSIHTPKEKLDEVKLTIINSEDKEAATMIAVNFYLYMCVGKIESDTRSVLKNIVEEIIKQLPKEATLPILKHLFENMENIEKPHIASLLQVLEEN